jgi:hypothetical protein
MPLNRYAAWMLEQEARALLTRLGHVKPFALQESMLPAANLLPEAQIAIERFLMKGRKHLHELVSDFLRWIRSPQAEPYTAQDAQRRFTFLRLRFNAVITHFDLFDNVITQRSESEIGVWLSGLDVVSRDALRLGNYYEPPAVICYLDRGIGAAIRRARTRLPGGGDSPVAVVKVPRERLVGSGIASSLVHEVGHQAAALLELVESLGRDLDDMARRHSDEHPAWFLWKRWISEIVADTWSIARVGIASTLGLMGVVSLPRVFVFRVNMDDPHPTPWIRVKLSAAIGDALYPQPAWSSLARLWEEYYPTEGLAQEQIELLRKLERTIPALADLIIHHRPTALHGRSLIEVLETRKRRPQRLRRLLDRWREAPEEMYEAAPTVVFAAIGQGRVDGRLEPEEESVIVTKLLSYWALKSTLEAASNCAKPREPCRCHSFAPAQQQTDSRFRGESSWRTKIAV